MMIEGSRIPDGARLTSRLVVIGAGPAGIVCALEAARRGVDVIVVETGGRRPDQRHQNLSKARLVDPDLHAPVELTVSRQVGGTSAIWGGRCVPYDPVDFAPRDVTPGSTWPVRYDELQRYFSRACDWMQCGRPLFRVGDLNHLRRNMIDGLDDGVVQTSTLERWSLPTDFGKVYSDALRRTPGIRVIVHATCVRIDVDAHRATGIECRSLGGTSFTVTADDIVVANGGLESTRLLMCSPGPAGRSVGDHSGHLGRWYMAHLEGVIADLVIAPDAGVIWDYEKDVDGSYIRRRFTFTPEFLLDHGLPNISGWIANPELSDAAHHNGRLSLTYLALISPVGSLFAPPAQRMSLTGTKIPGTPYGVAERTPVRQHLANVGRHPVDTLRFLSDFAVKRTFSRRRKPPGFFVSDASNRFPFQYHAEHLPHYDSRVRLGREVDELGMPMLDIDIRFSAQDIDGVLQAHRHWDAYLRSSGVGRLELWPGDPAHAVRARTGGGFHQVGTTRMSRQAEDGVVDENLTVHGVPNLHVASSSVFVTSGQANSTFMIVVFALRLIDRLYGRPHADSARLGAPTTGSHHA